MVSGVAVFAVLACGGLYVAHNVLSARASANSAAGCAAAGGCAAGAAGLAVAVPPEVVTIPPNQLAGGKSSSGHSAAPRATGTATGTPRAQSVQSAAPAAGSAAASASPAAAPGTTAAGQVLALINQARATAGLPALTVTAGLTASSAAHNQLMASGCGLSHQCPGEASLGPRETAAGVIWTAAGENIGDGGPVADTDAAIAQMAVGLTQSMLNEQPPDDGHRMNILSSTFTHIGITVYRSSSGTVWLTQDFSN
jgi:uncharacterized protein YkwD